MKAALFLLVLAAMSARAANVLYFRDAPIGADRMAEALAAGGHSVTVATGAADFKTRIESGAHEVGVFFVQKRAASESAAAIQSLSAFVAAGGRALYADWSENAALAAGFGAGFTGRANARSVTQLALNPAATPVPEPIALRQTGWFRSTVGLTALAGSSAAARFENGDAAIVRDATGRSLTFGFLNDTPEMAAVFRRGVEFVLANLPLEPFSGQFSQLLTGPGGVAGRIELTLGSGGAFTGRLLFRDLNEVLMGAFGTDGIFRGTASNLAITLTLRFAGTEPRLAGTVTDGATTWTSDSATVRAGAEPPQFGRKGRYTFVVPDSLQAGLPRGDAWAVFAGDTSGRLRFAGRFADGVKFSGDGSVQPDGSVPLYLVSSPPAESLGGALRFSDARGTNLTGDFTWTRFAGANAFAVTTPVAGGRFIPPAAGQRMFTFQNAAAKIAKAKLSADLPGFPKKVIFNVRAAGLEAAPPNPNGLALQFTAATGKVTGSFEHRTLGRCKVTGVLVQPANAVRGNFAGGGGGGTFLLAPR